MPIKDIEALGYAVITDIRGCAGDKSIHLAGIPAAERARERRPEQATDPCESRGGSQIDHPGLLIHDSSAQSITAAGPAPALLTDPESGRSGRRPL
jgi:hypothetical protein